MRSERGVPPSYDPEGFWYKGWSPFFDPSRGRPGYGLRGRGAHFGYEQARRNAMRARRAENQFAVQLRHIARQIGQIVRGTFDPEDPTLWASAATALEDYARLITPWATATVRRLLAEVARRDAASWHELGKTMGTGLREQIASADLGPVFADLMQQQVHLITSLPLDARDEIHAMSIEAMQSGERWPELVPWIQERLEKTGGNALARANLIARTETGRAATTLAQVRATHVGSEGYVWRTAKDKAVRPRHKELEGTFHRWSEPPLASERGQREMHYHPGAGPNCRCFPEIVLPGQQARGRVPRNPAFLEALRAQGYTEGAAFEGG